MLDFRALWKELPIRKSRFTESQIVGILKESEAGIPIADLVRSSCIPNFPPVYPGAFAPYPAGCSMGL